VVALVVMVVGVMSCSTTASPPTSSDLHSTPGRTACGASADCASYPQPPTDNEGQPFCCLDTSALPACYTGNLASCESGVPIYCDEAADCAPGLHCCNLGAIRTSFQCLPSCNAEIQLCKTNAECENGKACTPYVCSGGAYVNSSQPLSTCGPLAFNPGFGTSFGCVPAP
jgi:hypothetical protein